MQYYDEANLGTLCPMCRECVQCPMVMCVNCEANGMDFGPMNYYNEAVLGQQCPMCRTCVPKGPNCADCKDFKCRIKGTVKNGSGNKNDYN